MRLFINYKPSPQSKHALKKIEWLKWSGEKYNLSSKKFWWQKICFKHAIGNRKLLTNEFQSSSLFYRDTKNRREKIKIEVRSLSKKTESRLRYVKGLTHTNMIKTKAWHFLHN